MSFFLGESNFVNCLNVNKQSGIETLLRLMLHELLKQNAGDGMVLVDTAAPFNGVYNEHPFYAVIPRDNTIIEKLMIDTDYVQDDCGLTGKTLYSSDPAIMAPTTSMIAGYDPFTYIKLTQGSVWVLLKLDGE